MKINYQLEAIFIQNVIELLDEIRRKSDASRDVLSSKINKVFNGPWGKGNKDLERGAIIGIMKTGEMSMNEVYGRITKLQWLLNGRLVELNTCSNIEQSKQKSK